ncbi:MAG: acyltransferase, partial [Burkholderiales bacterium]
MEQKFQDSKLHTVVGASPKIVTQVFKAPLKTPARLVDLDRAKGFAIFLVVLGHLARGAPPDNEWYGVLKQTLYLFHMPLFMFLSGVTMQLSYKPLLQYSTYPEYVRQKFIRLMPAFLIFGALTLAGKIVGSSFMQIDNPPSGWIDGLTLIFFKPIHSTAGSLWYIYVLFMFYALLPLLHSITRSNLLAMLAIGAVIHFIPMTDWFMLNGVAEYLLYLVLGFLAARHYSQWTVILDKYAPLLISIFCGLLLFCVWTPLPKTLMGLCAIPAVHALARTRLMNRSSFWLMLGTYT